MSPDGDRLAFVSTDPVGEAPYLVAGVGLSVADLRGSTVTDVHTLEPGPRQLDEGLSDLSWSPDGHALSFSLLDGTSDLTTFWTVALDPAPVTLASAHEIPMVQPGVTWNGYLGHLQHGQAVGLGVRRHADGRVDVVMLNPVTGRILATLFGAPGAICVPPTASTPGSRECVADFVNPVIGDTSGRDVLLSGVIPIVDGVPTTSGAADAYRWSVGERHAVRLTPQVLQAAWGPTASS